MQGAIFLELRAYAELKFGNGAWAALLERARLGERQYSVLEAYPDSEVLALVSAASEISGHAPDALLEDFGAFIAPHLVEMFWGCVDPTWKTLDIIENTEDAIHRVVRLKNPLATPPQLHVTRRSADEVVIRYSSERRLCALAKGIARGLAHHFDERVAVLESECMKRGDPCCLIAVQLER